MNEHQDRAATAPDVSVIVAVYNPGPNIDGLLASLDTQTLPAGALEVVLVDDGSTDGTLERLQQLATVRPYLVVRSIPNSGWPGRPRNVGFDAARGEYVFFADHDDEFFPDTLEHLVSTARRNDADVVYPKVVRRGLSTPYWPLAQRDIPVADLVGDQLIVSRSVHKLFRRSFLAEHDIRFLEGPVRLEDHIFMGHVLARRPRVSVVASRPGYVWIQRSDGTNTSSRRADLDEYFAYVAQSVEPLMRGADDDLRRQVADVSLKRIFLPLRESHWTGRPRPEKQEALAAVARFLDTFVPPDLEDELPRLKQWSVHAIHAGDVDRFDELLELRYAMAETVTADRVQWSPGGDLLCVEATAVAAHPSGEPVTLERLAGEPRLPAALGARPDDDATLRPQDLGTGELTIRHRASRVEWPLRSSAFEVDHGDATLRLRVRAEISPLIDAFGQDLATGTWDVMARVDLLGERRVVRVGVDEPALPPAGDVGERRVEPYRTVDGTLALKVRDPAAGRPRVTGLAWQDTTVLLQVQSDQEPPPTLVVVRVRGQRDHLAYLSIGDGAVSFEVPDRPVGTVLDLWTRSGSGEEQRLTYGLPSGSDAAGPAEGGGWRAYATRHGSFSLKREHSRAVAPSSRRPLLRRLLGR